MKKWFILLLALFMFPAVRASAENPPARKLTVMVYMCGSNLESGYGSASGDIEEMLDAGIGSGVTVLVLAGALTGFAAFYCHLSVGVLIAAFFLLAFPAGFFSFYSVIAKELNPPEVTGLAVAVLNFSAFVFIALFGNISGIILGFWKNAVGPDGVFPGTAYTALFAFLAFAALLSVLIGLFVPETRRRDA